MLPDVKMGGLEKSQQKINKSHLMPYSISGSGIAAADWTSDSFIRKNYFFPGTPSDKLISSKF